MRILFAAQSVPEDQSTIHRVVWPANELKERGHDTTVIFGVKKYIGGRSLRMISPQALYKVLTSDYDVVVVSRDASPLARTLQICSDIRNVVYVYDFDDAIYTRMNITGTPIPNPVRFHLNSILTKADCVTTGTEWMSAFATDYNSSVETLTTPVNTDVFRSDVSSPREYERPVVGWMGVGPDHIDNLDMLVEPLIELADKGTDFRFRLVSALDAEVKKKFQPLKEHIPVDYGFDAWQPIEMIVRELQTFDIGVCPLSMDDPYMEGKSPMKVLEMMATGLPVIASDVGTYGKVVTDGETGLIADSPQAWVDTLSALLEQPKYRTHLAERGRQFVLDNYSVTEYVDQLESILEETVT